MQFTKFQTLLIQFCCRCYLHHCTYNGICVLLFSVVAFYGILIFLAVFAIFAFNLWDLLNFCFWGVFSLTLCTCTSVCVLLVFCVTPFMVFSTLSLHLLSLLSSLNSERSGGSLSNVYPKSSNNSGSRHSFPFLPNLLKSGSSSLTFLAIVVFLTSVM